MDAYFFLQAFQGHVELYKVMEITSFLSKVRVIGSVNSDDNDDDNYDEWISVSSIRKINAKKKGMT